MTGNKKMHFIKLNALQTLSTNLPVTDAMPNIFVKQKRHMKTRVADHRQRSRDSAVKDHGLMCDTRENISILSNLK